MRVPQVRTLVAASSATRLLLSPTGGSVVAELGGDWRDLAFHYRGEEIPPVLKLIDMTSGQVVATANGWALGAPVGADAVYLEEHDEEYRYRVRSISRPQLAVDLEPPEGAWWLVKAGVDFGPEKVAVVLRVLVPGPECPHGGFEAWREDLWIAVVDRATLAVETTRTLTDTRTPYHPTRNLRAHSTPLGGGLVGDPTRPQFYLLERPEPGGKAWIVSAYDSSLHPIWQTPMSSTVARPDNLPTPTDPGDQGAAITTTGDGAHVLVVVGARSRYGDIGWPLTIHVLEATRGEVVKVTASELRDAVREVVPAAGKPQVGLLHVLAHHEGLGESVVEVFPGVSILNGTSGKTEAAYEVARSTLGIHEYEIMRELRPGAMAIDPAGIVWLAPEDYWWAEKYRGVKGLPPREKTGVGLDAPEIHGLVTTPTDWHDTKRPRVKERDRSLLKCRKPGPPPSEPPPPLVPDSVKFPPEIEKIRSVIEPLHRDPFLADERACQYKDWLKDAAGLHLNEPFPPGVDTTKWNFEIRQLDETIRTLAKECVEEDLGGADYQVNYAANLLIRLGRLLAATGTQDGGPTSD